MFYTPIYKVEEVFITCSQSIDWGISYLDIPFLWSFSRGKGIKIGVVDTGINPNHEDLKGAIIDYKDFTGEGLSEGSAHGTHVTGILAARDNNVGIIGVAPECSVLNAKVLADAGCGSVQSIIEGVKWCINCQVDIISLSLGSKIDYDLLHNEIRRAYANNIAVISAAGNDSYFGVNYPALWPEVISVGAIDKNGNVSEFSSKGWKLDVCAPGQDILSCFKNNGYATISGTSQATPMVSGVLALYLSYLYKTRQPVDIKSIYRKLKSTAFSSFNNSSGFGIVSPKGLFI